MNVRPAPRVPTVLTYVELCLIFGAIDSLVARAEEQLLVWHVDAETLAAVNKVRRMLVRSPRDEHGRHQLMVAPFRVQQPPLQTGN